MLAIFLKEQGIGRDGLDFFAHALKICQTDNYQWKLWTRLADRLGSEAEMRRLIPLCASLIACSFDNVNLDILKHFGGGGHVDLVAAIGYYHALLSRRRVAELPQQPLRLDFVRDFGIDAPKMTAIWERFQRQVLTCMQEEAVGADGDVEVRLAKMLIRDAPPENMVGVEGRRVPDDVVARYLGVVETGTKRQGDIKDYIDGLKQVLHVGEEGGRLRVVLVGDQETFTHAHKIKEYYGEMYDWVLPWIGDWHLLEHTLDVIFRKWGGFGIFPLAKAADGYNKKLENKDYHKRHFVFVGILEALWKACVGEVESREGTMEPEELLGRLMQHRGSTDHKTFGQWVQLLLNDGMAYLAVYTSIRVGDFELREAAIRRIAPLFLGYNKNLYHALCIRHLADIAKLLPSERKFMSETFSLSLSGNPGKNVGLDEIQEMTMNKQIKQHAYGTRPRYLQRKTQTLQVMANAARDWKESFGSNGVYKRKIYASQHRTLFVKKVHLTLTATGSPFRLDDEKGRVSVISGDGRVALPQLESTMLEASATSTTMFKTLTLQEFDDEELDGGTAKLPQPVQGRKRVYLDTFSKAARKKKSKTLVSKAKDNEVRDLRTAVGRLTQSGGRKKGFIPLVSGMPLPMGAFSGELHAISKSVLAKIFDTDYARGVSVSLSACDAREPNWCVVDMATIVHQMSTRTYVGRQRKVFKTWREYAANLVENLVYALCSREGTIKGRVVLCLDKRSKVGGPKAVAHAKRMPVQEGTAGAGLPKPTHKFLGAKKKKKAEPKLYEIPPVGFNLDDPTPVVDWNEFLSDRQNRDGVFAVICIFLRELLQVIAAHHGTTYGEGLSPHALRLRKINLRVDGEPILSSDQRQTVSYSSWETSTSSNGVNTGVVVRLEDNGIGEGVFGYIRRLDT